MKPHRFNPLVASAAVALSLSGSAFAASYQWDGNGATPGLGGSSGGLAWNTGNSTWDLVGTGLDNGTDTTVAYTFTAADTAIFGGTAASVFTGNAMRTVTIGATTFNTTGYTLNLTHNGTGNSTYNLGNLSVTSGTATLQVRLGGSSTDTASLGTTNFAGFKGALNIGGIDGSGAVLAQPAGSGKAQIAATTGNGLTSAATVNVVSNGTLYVSGTANHAAAITLNGGDTGESLGQLRMDAGEWSGNITLAGAMTGTGDGFIGSNTGGSATISGIIGETGGAKVLSKVGAGTIILTRSNTYTGGTTISAGTLGVNNLTALGAGDVSVTGNSALSTTTGFANKISINSGVTLSLSGGFVNVSGIISGDGNVTATGSIHLRGENTYTGKTTVSGGFLCIDRDRNLGAVPGSFTADSITMTGGGSISNYIATAPVVLHANRGITLASGNTGLFDVAGQTMTVNGVITGAGNLLKQNTGHLLLAAQNTYTGRTQIYGGTISYTTIKNVGDTTGSSLGNVANATDGTISVGFVANSVTLRYTGTGSTTDRVINLAGTTGGVTLEQSGTGLLKFDSAFTATGAGVKTLTLTGSTTGTGEIAGAIVNNSTLNTTSLSKTGTGTWTLSGDSNYTGTTDVTAGTLVINGSIGNTSTTIGTSGTLMGRGTIGGTLSVNGTLAPGNSIESLGSGAVTFNSSSTFSYELNTTSVSADLLYSSGALSIANGTTLLLSDLGLDAQLGYGTKFTLISYLDSAQNWTGGLFTYDSQTLNDGAIFTLGANQWLFDYNDLTGGANFAADQSGASRFVTMTAIPEPSAALLGGLGLMALLRRRRI